MTDANPVDTGGRAFKAAMTAHLNGDRASYFRIIAELDQVELSAFTGAAFTYAQNLLGLVAGMIDKPPAEAWEWLLDQERQFPRRAEP